MEETKKYLQYFSSETIASLRNLWEEIGYSDEEKKIRLHQLAQRIQNVHSDFIENTVKKCQDLTRKTNEIKSKHVQKLKAIGAPKEEIKQVKENEIVGTIKDKYIDTLNNYNEFLNIYNQRVDEFKKYYIEIQSCFKEIGIIDTIPQCCNETEEHNNEEESQEQIEEESQKENNENYNDSTEIDDQSQNNNDIIEQNKTHVVFGYSNQENTQNQGEFAQIGEEDLTNDRLKRFEDKAKELQKEVSARFVVFSDIKNKIIKLQADLCEVSPPEIEEMLNGHVYSDRVCEQLTDYHNYLSEIFETRKKYISEMAVEIVKLWDALDVDEETRNRFLQTHNAFSQKNVQDCIDEAERLTKIRNDHLPEIIEKMKKEISNICDDLSYSEEQKQEIYEKCDNDKLDEKSSENEIAKDIQFYSENKELFIDFDNVKDDEEEQSEEEDDEHEEEIQSAKDEKIDNEEKQEEGEQPTHSENIEEEEEDEKGEERPFVYVEVIKPEDLKEEEEEKSQIPVPEFEENVEETKNFVKIYNNYEMELYRLRKIRLVSQPIIDSIKQRQEMIDEYNNVMEELKQAKETASKQKNKETTSKPKDNETTSKPKKKEKNKQKDMAKSAPVKKKKNVNDDQRTEQLNGQIELKTIRVRPPNAQDKIYQEKVIRRYKTILPRLEKKLLITLIQFREDNGEDFLWNQKPIINELKHIHVTQSEIRAQSKSRNSIGQSRKKSISTLDSTSNTTSNISKRKSLQPSSKQTLEITAKHSRNQRKSTIPRNPNFK